MTDQPRRRGRPPRPGGPDPTRSLRIGPEWDQALTIANQRGESLSSVVSAALRRYVNRHRDLLDGGTQ